MALRGLEWSQLCPCELKLGFEGAQVRGQGVSVAELMKEAQDGSGRLFSIWRKAVFAGAASVLSTEFLQQAKHKHNLLLC